MISSIRHFNVPLELHKQSEKYANERNFDIRLYDVQAIRLLNYVSSLNDASPQKLGTKSHLELSDGSNVLLPRLNIDDESESYQTLNLKSLTDDDVSILYKYADKWHVSADDRVKRSLRLANFICEHIKPGEDIRIQPVTGSDIVLTDIFV